MVLERGNAEKIAAGTRQVQPEIRFRKDSETLPHMLLKRHNSDFFEKFVKIFADFHAQALHHAKTTIASANRYHANAAKP